jgi:transcription elongation GreA/GreB family factor
VPTRKTAATANTTTTTTTTATAKKTKTTTKTTAATTATTTTAKLDAVQALVTALQDDLDTMLRAAKSAHEAATHPEAKPENDKDTRGLELSYLAAGQSARAAELQRALAVLKTIAIRDFGADDHADLSAVVVLRDDDTDAVTRALLLPLGAGRSLSIDGEAVAVVSPAAPLGKAMLGKKVGDLVEVVIAGKPRAFEVLRVS